MKGSSTLRIKFNLKVSNGSFFATGRIYKNGIALGTSRVTNSTIYIEYTEDLAGWLPGDTLEIWLGVNLVGASADSNLIEISVQTIQVAFPTQSHIRTL